MARVGVAHCARQETVFREDACAPPKVGALTAARHPCREAQRNHLAFRDYLRAQPGVAAEYMALKRGLAAKNHGMTLESREIYSLGKSDFVARMLKRALREGSSKSDE